LFVLGFDVIILVRSFTKRGEAVPIEDPADLSPDAVVAQALPKEKILRPPPPPFPKWTVFVLALLAIMSWTGRALIPFFEDVPLLVVGLAPEAWLIPLAADKVAPWLLLVVVSTRLLLADPIWYYLGRYFTERVLSEQDKKRRKGMKTIRKILQSLVEHKETKHLKSPYQRWLIQGLAYTAVLLYSTGIVMCAAGILELRRRVVAALAVIGTVAQVYALMAVGSYLFR
jgi:membrane protein YqaA with SNARE-associated domain